MRAASHPTDFAESASGCPPNHRFVRSGSSTLLEAVASCDLASSFEMASTTKLSQQLHRTASHWPVDPFRPHLQLGNFLKALADHPQLTPQAVRAARALQDNEFQRKVHFGSVLTHAKTR